VPYLAVSHGIDTAVQAVKTSGLGALADCTRSQSETTKLIESDHPMLLRREAGECVIQRFIRA